MTTITMISANKEVRHHPWKQWMKKNRTRYRIIFLMFFCLVVLLSWSMDLFTENNNNDSMTNDDNMETKKSSNNDGIGLSSSSTTAAKLSNLFYDWDELLPNDLSRYDQCSIPTLCPVRQGANNVGKTKPLWVPSYPASGEELIRPTLIDTVFQQQAAAKNFYTKKCKLLKANTFTVTCSQIHPIVSINPHPLQRINDYASSVIMLLRNPINVAPALYNYKANQYHNVIGQVKENDWITFRTQYMMPNAENHNKSFISDWINFINDWKSYVPTYHIRLYVPYESLFSFTYGPKIIQQMMLAFENENFTIPIIIDNAAPNNNKESVSCLECIWYHSMTKERLLQYYNVTRNKYEYYQTYLPSYTKQQRDYMIQQLQKFSMQYQISDTILYDIIQQYIVDIQYHTRIDA